MLQVTRKKALAIAAVCVALAGILIVFATWTMVIEPERQFVTIPEIPPQALPADWADDLVVGIVGDSWVADQKLDAPLMQALADHGLAAEVVSSGQHGAKARQVVRNWFTTSAAQHSCRPVWDGSDVDYVVILVGVNDSAGHVGADSYAFHVAQLVTAVQRIAAYPVVVELPEYGIEEMPSRSIGSAAKLALFRYLFDDGQINVIERYRKTLSNRLSTQIEQRDVALVDFDPVCADYRASLALYKDPAHLNSAGNAQLAAAIAQAIASAHQQRQRTMVLP